ncbi:MAG: hypothetical protein VXV96_09650 [Bdellovibrionota bacterium]|nr:hypothetical protein [Bdellovibrionota bacterium]
MIGPTSELVKLNNKIKLFGITPSDFEKNCLLSMWDEITTNLPEKSNTSINFFKDGDTYHGEAIMGFLSICVLSRETSSDLLELSRKMKNDVIKKLNKSNSGNGWEGGLQLNAV